MPVFPGQLRYIRKNLFHAVFVLDPGSICGLEVIFPASSWCLDYQNLCVIYGFIGFLQEIDMITNLYENSFPMRFGVMLYSSNLIKEIGMTGGKLHESEVHSQNEDLSSLVFSFSSVLLY